MNATVKTYAAKSSVMRVLKQQSINPETVHINHGPDGWYFVTKEVPKVEAVAPKEATGEKKPRNGACLKVWEVADSMPGAKRSAVVAACIATGLNLGTSKTQYQLWFTSKKAG